MILDSTLLNLKAVLAGAVSANQPDVHVDYRVWDVTGNPTKPGTFRSALNSTTDVIILAAPKLQSQTFEPVGLSVYNKDTASVKVTIKTDDGTTVRIIMNKTLATLETLHWSVDGGWYVTNA